jgi:secondary thiamine-phosphate synthase enzyme
VKQHQHSFTIQTHGQQLSDITGEVASIVREARIVTGVAHVFIRHTSASLIINENADPDVRRDLEAFMKRLVPDGDPAFIHTLEGPDDMAASLLRRCPSRSARASWRWALGRASMSSNTAWRRTGGKLWSISSANRAALHPASADVM